MGCTNGGTCTLTELSVQTVHRICVLYNSKSESNRTKSTAPPINPKRLKHAPTKPVCTAYLSVAKYNKVLNPYLISTAARTFK